MRVNIVFSNNGYGLKKDAIVISNILRKHGCKIYFNQVQRDDLNSYSFPVKVESYVKRKIVKAHFFKKVIHYDVNIFLEKIVPDLIERANKNLFIPNQDWFTDQEARYLDRMDAIFCKSKVAFNLFKKLVSEPAYTGFTSIDMYRPEVKHESELGFLHLAGRSKYKGTSRLIDLWNERAPGRLTVIYRQPAQINTNTITLHSNYLPDEKISDLNNRMKYHLCLSECEGFGHYICEALSCGATIVTVDASPMNEIVEDHYGYLLKPDNVIKKKYFDKYLFDKNSLLETIHNIKSREGYYSRSFIRSQYLKKKKEFEKRFWFNFNKL
jgi:glycosyltransferase involved in cell wall biosynthesis